METVASNASRICRLVDWMPPRWVLLTLFCAVLVVRGQFMLAHPDAFNSDPDAYGRVARNIHRLQTFGRAANNNAGPLPTAARPPLAT